MAEQYRWVEYLVQRDAICTAILDLEATMHLHHHPSPPPHDQRTADRASSEGREDALDDPDDFWAVGPARDAYVQLVQVLEDPIVAAAIAHALWRILRRREAEADGSTALRSAPASIVLPAPTWVQRLRRLCGCLFLSVGSQQKWD